MFDESLIFLLLALLRLHGLLEKPLSSILGDLGRLLLLLEVLLKQAHDLIVPHLLRAGDQGPVGCYLEVLNLDSRRDDHAVDQLGALVGLPEPFLQFLGRTLGYLVGLAVGLLAELVKDLLQLLDVPSGLLEVILDGAP